jgi:hypothetical protein
MTQKEGNKPESFDSTKTYNNGDIVDFEGQEHECVVEILQPGYFNPKHWVSPTLTTVRQ